jgi:hypothetical protein
MQHYLGHDYDLATGKVQLLDRTSQNLLREAKRVDLMWGITLYETICVVHTIHTLAVSKELIPASYLVLR